MLWKVGSPSPCCSRAPSPASTGSTRPRPTESSPRSSRFRPKVNSAAGLAGLTVLVPARNEEEWIAATVAAFRRDFPDAQVLVIDGSSRDRTAELAEAAGATVLQADRLGKGEALSAGERAARPGPLLLADADL